MTWWKLWALFVAILAGLGAAWNFGYVDYVLANDVTRLSVVILGLFLTSSAWVVDVRTDIQIPLRPRGGSFNG